MGMLQTARELQRGLGPLGVITNPGGAAAAGGRCVTQVVWWVGSKNK
jgi:hypothetical protein